MREATIFAVVAIVAWETYGCIKGRRNGLGTKGFKYSMTGLFGIHPHPSPRATLASSVVVGLLSACGGGGDDTATTPAPTPIASTTTVVEADPSRATIDVVGEPGAGSVVADGAVWTPGRGVIHVIDIETRVATDEIVVGPGPQRPLELAGSLWVANRISGSISIIDMTSRSVTDTISLGLKLLKPAIEVEGEVWLSSDSAVHVIDPTDLSLVATIDVGRVASSPVFHAGMVWVTSFEDGTLLAIDPATRSVMNTIDVGPRALAPAVAGDNVFVLSDDGLARIDVTSPSSAAAVEPALLNTQRPVAVGDEVWILSSTITVVDQTTLAVVSEIELTAEGSIVLHEGLAWLVDSLTGKLVGIDPETRGIVVTAAVGNDPSTPFVSDGSVWVANKADGTLTVTEVPNS